MEIILREDIENLGFKDELVNVKNGFARNFLVPQGKAIVATASAKKVWEENLKQRSHKEAKVKESAEKTAKALKDAKISVGAKVGEAGKKIFGSVNTIQLADAINALGHEVDKKTIKILGSQIKELGTYQAEIRLHRDITVAIDFEVVAE
ncbi:MAG: 50S ribosomal protein L9 [Bacteroidetes bacterium]|nr:MAG: 50S ribosomal protein L9 [Bacteroidota bacterium]MBL1145559.1 50S ribosomal protein L9 [Bacteroidota bacterium]MCB0802155.1 50S ribosomal protein L9 [Flavobacteriales bacterium]NOG58355.1 50S ribosomal protein L9 [Bacteroidota bacterium]